MALAKKFSLLLRVIRIDLAFAPAMSGLLLTIVQVFETRKEAETWVTPR